jgi:hypothetical protein
MAEPEIDEILGNILNALIRIKTINAEILKTLGVE